MRKEAEELLEIIGTDAELGTHSSMPKYVALTEYVKGGKDHFNIFRGYSKDIGNYRTALEEIVPFLNQMSSPAFRRLISFVDQMDLGDKALGEKIKQSNAFPSWCEEQIEKRALFIQFFSGTEPPLFNLDELKEEEKVRKNYPWQWIDAVEPWNLDIVREEIINQLQTTRDVSPFVFRIPYYLKCIKDGKKYVKGIIAESEGYLPEQDVKILRKSLKRK